MKNKILNYQVGYKEFNEAERTIVHYITTPDRDRGGDIVNPFGMLDTDFAKSPSVFYNHNYNLPVAKSLWRKATDGGVLAKTKFSKTDFANDIYTLHKEGIINTWSIGFRIPDAEDAVNYDKKTNTLFINRWELVEYSSAPIAMNPNSLDIQKGPEPPIDRIEMITMIKGMCKSAEMCQQIRLMEFEDRLKEEKAAEIAGITCPCRDRSATWLGDRLQTHLYRVTPDDIRKMFAGAISRITGRKIKI